MTDERRYRVYTPGDESALTLEQAPSAEPGRGQVRVRHTAIGLNFIDIYHRSGLYPLDAPFGLGLEAAGVVDAIGPGVSGWREGDRVAYCSGPPGAYADSHVVPADRLLALPDGLEDEVAAATLLKGLTAAYLLHHTYPLKAGETLLWHAAAGGVGLLACQWAKHLGARVIGTVGSQAKADLAMARGCDTVILYRDEDVVERVRELTAGQGVPVVYDSVGKDTFEASLDCLAPRGLMVSFGNASGAVPPFSPLLLSQKGSLFFTRPTLAHYTTTRDELVALADLWFDAVLSGAVQVDINQRYALNEIPRAHRDLAGRNTTGASVIIP
ncbi:quinone oxidoreductase family protein [Marinimicrobium sp. ARAG 43.8]|uniref:quinone oxidoreductase family protein n=1 Tax=Marinimicrobium sp. ARAG 43.8 TaxID=3418719 RepID=UPI003CEDB18C